MNKMYCVTHSKILGVGDNGIFAAGFVSAWRLLLDVGSFVLLALDPLERQVVAFSEAQARMEGVERQDRHHDHHTFQPNEQVLVLDQSTLPALTEFGHTVHGSNEDTHGGEREGDEEGLERPTLPELGVCRVQGLVAHGPHSPESLDGEIGTQEHEDQQGKDLEGQPRNHDVITVVRALVLVTRDRGHRAPNRLQEQRSDITRDKNSGIGQRRNARILTAKGVDDTRQAEIKPSGHESGSNGETAYLNQETVLGWISSVLSVRQEESIPDRTG